MNKRYQVFVSSTFADLQEERRRVIQTLMEMDCIPSGMELFPAVDEEQFEFIKRIIDDCDYYVLIVGGKYGTTTVDGVSFTEKEYDYALNQDIKVLAFLHADPEQLTVERSETDPAARERLRVFRDRVASGRLVKFWHSADELPALVALSLQKTIKIYPATGWVRANLVPSGEILTKLDMLEKENDSLKKNLEDLGSVPDLDPTDLAQGEDEIELEYSYELHDKKASTKVTISDSFTTTWDGLFAYLAPGLIDPVADLSFRGFVNEFVSRHVTTQVKNEHGPDCEVSGLRLSEKDVGQVKLQFRALGLIQSTGRGWRLTKMGDLHLLESGVIRRTSKC